MRRVTKVHCPRCGEQLEVDSTSGRVERHWPKGEKGPQTPDLLARAAEAQRKAQQDADIDGLVKKAQERDARAEDALGQALKKAAENPDEPPPPREIDLD